MNKKELHDFLLKEVANFVETSLFQSSIKEYDVVSGCKNPFDGDFLQHEDEYKLMLLMSMHGILTDMNNEFHHLKKDFLELTSLPRFNNDNVLAFLEELYRRAKVNCDSFPSQAFTDVLEEVIYKLMRVPSTLLEELPPLLSTPKALDLLEKGKKAGLLDKNFKPIDSYPDYVAALIADKIGRIIKIPKSRRWAPFRKYWGIDNLRQRYEEADKFADYPDYCKKIDSVFY